MSATEVLNEQCVDAWSDYAESASERELAELTLALTLAAQRHPNSVDIDDLAEALAVDVDQASEILAQLLTQRLGEWQGSFLERASSNRYILSVYGRALVSSSDEFGGDVPEVSEQEAEDWL